MQALEGITVVELGLGPALGLAGMVLADFGARVIRIEPPGGDPFRSMPSSRMWLRGKRSAVVNLDDSAQRARLGRFIDAEADALITTLDDDRLAQLRPANHLVLCRVRGFESRTDLPGYEGLVAAACGRMQSFAGIADRSGPGYSALMVGVHACAQMAASATLSGLFARQRGAPGRAFTVSIERALLAYEMGGFLAAQLRARGADLPRPPDPAATMPTINYHPVQCADGRWLQLGNLLPHLLQGFLDEVGLVWTEEEDVETFRDRMLAHMQTRPAQEWMTRFLANGNIVAHAYQTTQEAMDDPDILANGHAVSAGDVTQLGVVARLQATPGCASFATPEPGEFELPDVAPGNPHRIESAAAGQVAGIDGSGRLRHDDTGSDLPLAGTTIVEFATIIAAPLGCSVLADLGARVIKVESPGGDPFRAMGGGFGAARVNLGKESIELDLKTADGRETARRLIASADVLVHNFRQGVPEKLGIDYAAARALNPRIIHVGVAGYGPDGPGARRPSTHPIPGAAMGGVFYQLGGAPPAQLLSGAALRDQARRLFRANEVNPDPNTSMIVSTAVLLALVARQQHGVGQAVAVDMFCASAYANFDDFVRFPGKPSREYPAPDQTGFPHYGLRRTAQGWVFCTGAHQVSAEQSMPDFLQTQAARAAGLVVEAKHPEWGTLLRPGPLIATQGQIPAGPCIAGQHTSEIKRALGL
ncbi:MAG: CoA transferase [Pseudomonadales bacterium]